MRTLKRVCVSGYFDPIHSGHIDYLKTAKELGDVLIVILNNDKQANERKRPLLNNQEERKKILESIRYVHEVVLSIDTDFTVSKTLAEIQPHIFANGGNCVMFPEINICQELGIECITRVGSSCCLNQLEPLHEDV